MATNALFAEAAEQPIADCPPRRVNSLRIAGSVDPTSTVAHASCASCSEAGHACDAMPQVTDDRDFTLPCIWCFLAPLVVFFAAVVLFHEPLGDAVACLIGAAAWLGILTVSKLYSRPVGKHSEQL